MKKKEVNASISYIWFNMSLFIVTYLYLPIAGAIQIYIKQTHWITHLLNIFGYYLDRLMNELMQLLKTSTNINCFFTSS